MPAICIYLQIHQPFRLRRFTPFDADPDYFDHGMNSRILKRIAQNCYLPVTAILLEQIRRLGGQFKIAFSVTGVALEQLESHAPEVLHNLHALAATSCVEFLGETFYHSLTGLYSPEEFAEQVEMHRRMIRRLFNQTPTVFRNTELIYSNAIAALAARNGYEAVLAEGWDPVLNNRSAAFLYRANLPAGGEDAGGRAPLLILRNHRLSDAIAFGFDKPAAPGAGQGGPQHLSVEEFSQMVDQVGGQYCNIFMDCETFGEHHGAQSGILEFLRDLPERLLRHNSSFILPGEMLRRLAGSESAETAGVLDVPHPISWADQARDLGAWMGNPMQLDALEMLYALERAVKSRSAGGDPRLLADWRKLTTSDHVYYMSTKQNADGDVHAIFRPYDSPYDAYINFMNVIDHLRRRAQ